MLKSSLFLLNFSFVKKEKKKVKNIQARGLGGKGGLGLQPFN